MKPKSIKPMIAVIILMLITSALTCSCATGKIVLSNNADIDKYKYVVFGNKLSGNRELYDILLEVDNLIAETNLKVLSGSEISKVSARSDGILTRHTHVASGWDTSITVTFYDYNDNQCVAVVKGSTVGALRRKLDKLFNK